MNYEHHFEKLQSSSPKLENMPKNMETDFWEELYQAFKERFIAEKE